MSLRGMLFNVVPKVLGNAGFRAQPGSQSKAQLAVNDWSFIRVVKLPLLGFSILRRSTSCIHAVVLTPLTYIRVGNAALAFYLSSRRARREASIFFVIKPWTRQKIAPAFSAYNPSMDIND